MLTFAGACLLGTVAWAAPKSAKPKPVKVTMHQLTAEGVGTSAGSVTIRQTKEGLELAVDLTNLSPGEHGFHLHENGSCDPADKDGKRVPGQAAGPHWDPDLAKAHKGPGGGGHKGDLPKLIVPQGQGLAQGTEGKVKIKLPVTGLTLADVAGKSLMVHAGGDNYSDSPKPLGGGGDRIICGVIPAPGPTSAPAAAPVK